MPGCRGHRGSQETREILTLGRLKRNGEFWVVYKENLGYRFPPSPHTLAHTHSCLCHPTVTSGSSFVTCGSNRRRETYGNSQKISPVRPAREPRGNTPPRLLICSKAKTLRSMCRETRMPWESLRKPPQRGPCRSQSHQCNMALMFH